MKLLDLMGCKYIPAAYSGNKEIDNKTNTELYLRLVAEGKTGGFCPVLIDRETGHYVYEQKYGFSDSKEDYPKITKKLIELAGDTCFSVWQGRLIYNYYLDCDEYMDDVENDLQMLVPPTDEEYEKIFHKDIKEQPFAFGKDEGNKPYNFSYENQVFALVPTEKPWEVLAWIPMGGFNWCPDELHQIALAKGLYEQFGARIMYISFTCLEYYVPDPVVKKDDFEKVAKTLIAADNDIYEDYEVAARRILGSHNWFMWWD